MGEARKHTSKSQKKVENSLSLSLSTHQIAIQPSKKDIHLPLLPNPELLRIDPEVLAPQWWKPEGWMGKGEIISLAHRFFAMKIQETAQIQNKYSIKYLRSLLG